MRRQKRKFTKTGKAVAANRDDLYWSQWGRKMAQSADPTRPSTIVVLGDKSWACRWGHRHLTAKSLERCKKTLG